MASASTRMLSLKVLFISSGVLSIALGLKLSVPLVFEFSVSQAPLLWSTFRSWLKPPYLYFVINGIIITIAATSWFHQNNGENEETEELMQQQPRSKILVEQRHDLESSLDFDAVETVVYEQKERIQEVETTVVEAETNVAVVDDGDGGDVFAISKSEWIPPRRMDSSEIPLNVLFPVEKPPASSRSGHRKPVKANPEGIFSIFLLSNHFYNIIIFSETNNNFTRLNCLHPDLKFKKTMKSSLIHSPEPVRRCFKSFTHVFHDLILVLLLF